MKLVVTHPYKEDQIIFFLNDNLPYTIKAISENFAICTRPLDEKEDAELLTKPFSQYPNKTVTYTIIDFQENWRGPDNLIFSDNLYRSKKECKRVIQELENDELQVSKRHGIILDIDHNRTNIPTK